MEGFFVNDDRSVVDVSAYPELICEMGVGDVLAEKTEPRDLRRNDGARRQNGADLVAHGGTAGLSEDFPNGREGAGIEAELYDVNDMLHVEFGHVGFYAVCGRARVYGTEFSVGVDEDDVVVVLGEFRDEVADALNDVCLGNTVEEAHEVVVEENEFSPRSGFASLARKSSWTSCQSCGVAMLPKWCGHVLFSICCRASAATRRRRPTQVLE